MANQIPEPLQKLFEWVYENFFLWIFFHKSVKWNSCLVSVNSGRYWEQSQAGNQTYIWVTFFSINISADNNTMNSIQTKLTHWYV